MAQKLVRRNGVLQYEEDTSITGATEASGLPVPPSTPAGAAAAGASPDAAKMAGTPAQKQTVFNAAAAPQGQTLQDATRYTPSQEQQQALQQQQVATTQKAKRLEQLSQIKPAVQQAGVQAVQTVAGAQGSAPQVQATALASLPPEQQATIQQLMNDYIQNRNQVALQELSRAYGSIPEVSNFLRPFGDEIAAAGAAATQAAVGTQLSFDELQANGIDAAELAADLGIPVEALQGMTIPAIQQLAQQKQAEEFSRIKSLQAEMINPNTSPARLQQIRQELTNLGVAGVAGAEHAVRELNKDLASADAVTVAGRQMTTQEMLSDDGLSEIIRDAVRDEKFMAELQKMEPALAEWINSRKDSLVSLVADMKQQAADFGEVQKDFEAAAKLPTGTASEALIKAVTGLEDTSFLTADEVAAAKASLASSGLVAAASANKEILSLVNTFPEWATTLKDMTQEEIETAYTYGKEIQDDAALAAVLDVDGSQPFITDEVIQAEADAARPLLDVPPTVREDPAYIDLVKTGAVTADDVEMLKTRPEAWTTYKNAQRQIADIEDVSDDKLIASILGVDLSFEQLNKQIEEMEFAAKFGGYAEGAKKAAALRELLDQSDPKDGIIDERDIPGIRAKMLELAKKDAKLSEIVKDNKFDFDAVRERLRKSAIEGWQMSPSDWRHDVLDYVRDGQINLADLRELGAKGSDALLDKLMNDKAFSSLINPSDVQTVKAELKKQRREAAFNPVSGWADSLGLGQLKPDGSINWSGFKISDMANIASLRESLSKNESLPTTAEGRELRAAYLKAIDSRLAALKQKQTDLHQVQRMADLVGNTRYVNSVQGIGWAGLNKTDQMRFANTLRDSGALTELFGKQAGMVEKMMNDFIKTGFVNGLFQLFASIPAHNIVAVLRNKVLPYNHKLQAQYGNLK